MRRWIVTVVLLASAAAASGVERFPPPDFESGYELPQTQVQPPRATWWEYVDVAALVVAMGVATALALWLRSRLLIWLWMIACLAYFGFFRQGCVCSIGAIQNVSLGLNGTGYHVPWAVLAFFAVPLLVTLLFGRTFCAAVCPLGGLQDAVAVKSVRVPRWLEVSLGIIPFVYLGVAVLLAVTNSSFVICRYDPFVNVFRLRPDMPSSKLLSWQGPLPMLLVGVCVLIVGMFIVRPYCRYLCPLGALLRLGSRVSWKHATISPDECINCRLCEDACPVAAILPPTEQLPASHRRQGKGTLAAMLLLSPVIVAVLGVGGRFAGPLLSRQNYTVLLAERVWQEEQGLVQGSNDHSDAFRKTGATPETLYQRAGNIHDHFRFGGALVGAFVGVVIAGTLIGQSVRRTRTEYTIDKERCVSCGRCFAACPIERRRRKRIWSKLGLRRQ